MSATSRLAKIRARLDLPTLRRVAGVLGGHHRSIFTGHGQDFDDMVEYRPGDEIGDIDWKASARYGLPMIRRFEHESNLPMVLAVDTGRSMAALAPSGEAKSEVAMFAADVIAFLARSRGDLVALVAGDAERLVQLPARDGAQHVEMLLRILDQHLQREGPPADLSRVLDRVLTSIKRRTLVVIITDEARPALSDEDALRRLRIRHEIMVVSIADQSPVEGDGAERVVDVDHELVLPEFVGADPRLRAEAEAAVAARRDRVRQMLRRRGIEQVVAASSDDVVDALIDLFRRQRLARR